MDENKLIILLLLFDLLGIAFCCFFISRKDSDQTLRKLSLFWLITAFGSFLMMTDLSKPVWLIFYPLQKIQFPFRFSVIITLATTFLIALAISSIKKNGFSENFAYELF